MAEDEPVSRRLLERAIEDWGYEPVVCGDGDEARSVLARPDAPRLVLMDWMMPGLDGPEVCRAVRAQEGGERFYILLLTARMEKEDIVDGLQSGADDYVCKPFHREELQSRLAVGRRIVELQDRLAERVRELEQAFAEVKQLRGLLPICSYCKKIREGEAYTTSVEAYLAEHSDATFSHGVCPECYDRFVRPDLDELD